MNRWTSSGLDLAVIKVVEDLKTRSKPVSGTNEIGQVGSIAANGDTVVGEKIAEAMDKVGKEGVITVEEAKGLEFELDVVEGMQFDRGYLSPYFITNPEKMNVELAAPYILTHEKKLSIAAMLRSRIVVQSGRPLLSRRGHRGEALATSRHKLRGGQGRAVKAARLRRSPQGDARGHTILTGGEMTPMTSGSAENYHRDARTASASQSTRTYEPRRRAGSMTLSRAHRGDPPQRDTTSDYDREKLQESCQACWRRAVIRSRRVRGRVPRGKDRRRCAPRDARCCRRG